MKDLLRAIQSKRPEMWAHLLGQFILRRLTKSGISPAAAASALGVSRSTFYDYLSGRIAAPPAHRLEKLAAILDLPSGTFELFRSGLGSTALGSALGSAVLCSALLGREQGSANRSDVLGPDGPSSGSGSVPDLALALGAEELGALTPRARKGEAFGEHDEEDEEPIAQAATDVMLPVDPETGEEPDEDEEPIAEIEAGERPAIIAGEIEGHAVAWNELDTNDETLFRAGSFADTIAVSQARLLYWEHAHSNLGKGGSVPIGATFVLQEDPIGVFMRAWIADTALGRDIVTLMSVLEMAGLEMGASVAGFPTLWRPGFVEPARAWERGVDEGPGALLSFDLTEISLAGFPAIRSARVRLASTEPAAMLAAATERLARITGG